MTIYALFFFIAHHQAGVGAVAFAIGALIAIPLVRFRRPLAPGGRGGAGRDLRALRRMQTAANDSQS